MKMKAAYYNEYGSSKVYSVTQLPKPVPKKNQVLINIKATTVNRTDTGIGSGKYFIMRLITGLKRPKLNIPGTDFSGVVAEVGSDVSRFKVGDRVFGFNDEGIQSQAEFLALEEKHVFPMANNQSFEEAAASLEGPHYALNFMNKVKLKPGQKTLIYGSTGSIGSALVQLMKYNRIHVTAVCDTENVDKIKSLGPDRVMDYKQENYWEEEVVYDFVFDAVGKSSFSQAKPVLAKRGAYISSELGDNAENIYLSIFTPLAFGKVVKFPLPRNTARTIKTMIKIIEEGKYKPLIDKIYPLDEIRQAYSYVEKGFKVGNVVIRI